VTVHRLFVRRPVLEFGRLTNLADGIFGVAMTFLAFSIQLPAVGYGPDGGLAGKLTALLPQFLTLALSFAFSARCWLLHYHMHSVIIRGDERLLVLNLCFLFGIILVPFSADVLGNFPLSPLSVTVYAANGAFIMMSIALMWAYALVHPHFLLTHDARLIGWSYLTFCVIATLGFLISIGVAQFSQWLAIACWPGLLVPGHFLSPWLSRQLAPTQPSTEAADSEG
jgi:uncharacterized membrane protein